MRDKMLNPSSGVFRFFGSLAVGVVIFVAVLALSLSNGDSLAQGSPVAGVLPGTAGTGMTVAEREKLVEQQGSQREVASYGLPLPRPIPGKMGEGGCGAPYIPLVERTNSWSAGGSKGKHYLDVNVCAGAYSTNPDTGYFLVVRNRFPGATTDLSQALVPRSGPVRITGAPLGKKGSAHVWDAHIKFKGRPGTFGYLDLADDSVHITGGPIEGKCPAGTSGTPPNCVIDKAKLSALKVFPKTRVVKAGKRAAFTARVENIGKATARSVRFCVKAPKKLVTVTKWCSPTGRLPVGEIAIRKFKVTVARRVQRGEEISLKFKATAGVGTRNAKTTIKVK